MHAFTKKILIGIVSVAMILVTMVATTYAWVGIFTYSNTNTFQMNLDVQDLNQDYFLTISNTGEVGTFSEEISLVDIKREILFNREIDNRYVNVQTASDKEIEDIFPIYSVLNPVTTAVNDDNTLVNFKMINADNKKRFEMLESKDYYKMDVYLSIDTKEGIQESTEVNSNVFIAEIENTLKGTIGEFRFTNGNPFYELPSDSMSEVLKKLPNLTYYKVDSANAARFALSVYEPIPIDESYNNETPYKTVIYQGGSRTPIYNETTDVFDLGGNLPEDYNAALQELLDLRPNYSNSTVQSYKKYYQECLSQAVERGQTDLELINDNSLVWEAQNDILNNSYLGVHNGVQTKMKIEIYFWFEGWDADCLSGIDQNPVDFNLSFTANID